MDVQVDGMGAHAATGSRPIDTSERAIVLIHGAGMDRTVWQLQTRNVAYMGRQVYAVDLPGHGRSEGDALSSIGEMADWVARFMDAAGLESATLIGHSMGALIALECAARNPERMDKLCLMGVAEEMPVHPELLEAAKQNLPIASQLIVFWGVGQEAQQGGHPHPGLWIRGVSQTLLDLSRPGVLYRDLNACNIYKSAAEAAASITCDTLFVLGRHDNMSPVKKATSLTTAIKSSRAEIIDRCGHMMMLERPDEVHKALRSFIEI